ncbi:glycosyltransferase [Pseudomonas entomophila]|uniref:glycosyltransferase n=1 Tax=Pseudomonas entomophila TaxID=312306 RepID=UPI0024077079|nr:glycosyltransferase [Pseudomonas entomophila]MDF9617289.1 glycosyltransferase [Pseudomonas entomophila]
MKLLYVIVSMELGGAEQHLLRVSTALRKRGYQPEVFAIRPDGPLTQSFVEGGVPVHGVRLPHWVSRLIRNKRMLSVLGLLCSVPALCCLYWRMRPQVTHFFLPAAYLVGGITSLFAPAMKRGMSRRSLNLYQSKHGWSRRLEQWLHSKMNFVSGNSQAVVQDLLDEGVRQDKIRLIYNGVNFDRFDSARSRPQVRALLGIPDETLVFAIVANLIPYKGHADLIEAFGRVRAQLPAPWVCLFIGRDDGIGRSLQEQADALGVGGNIRFLGSRSDVPDLLCAADIGVLCSHEEGFSNAILEAMAAQLPMVVTRVGGNAEVVLDGETGRVVAPHAPDELAQALLAVALDSSRRAMGVAGRHRVETLFSMSACLQAYDDLYRGSDHHAA